MEPLWMMWQMPGFHSENGAKGAMDGDPQCKTLNSTSLFVHLEVILRLSYEIQQRKGSKRKHGYLRSLGASFKS